MSKHVLMLLALSVAGCGLFIKGKTPIAGVPAASCETVEPGLNDEPDQIKLTQPAKVAGIDLPAGSVVKRDGEKNYRLVSAGPTKVGGVEVPAGTEIELVKANSIVTGDRYNWNGVVHVGGQSTYSGHQVEAGDRVVFAGALFGTPSIMQIRLNEARQVRGKDYPAGTLIDIDAKGKITGAYTPEAQNMLAKERTARAKEREQRERDCKVQCSIVTEFHAHARCMGNCRN